MDLCQVMHLDAEKEMMSQCVALLGKFIAFREPNIRYLGLVSLIAESSTVFSSHVQFLRSINEVGLAMSLIMILHCIDLWQENMARMLMVTDMQDIIKRHQAQIITSLKDPDIR